MSGANNEPAETTRRYVPLGPADWLACSPWWVRLRRLPETPEDEFLASALVIGVGKRGDIHIYVYIDHTTGRHGCFEAWSPEDAMWRLERSRDGVAWFDCSREIGT
jgi:hypothetical protein